MLATAIGISAMGTNVEPYLQQLDHELSMSNVYFAKKEKKIDSLRILMNHARTPQEQFERSRALFLEFSNYSIDSARVYLTQTENYAREAGDSIGLMDMRLRQVWFMFHIGVSVEAFNLLNTQDASQMAPQLRENYYRQSVSSFYANFDEAFLKIYPTFVEEVNNMLRPEEQIVTPSNDKLTTELRILALLRLGINDSKDIATFLRCSNSTIYNYRTKMRNKAIDRDSFEEKIIYKKEENQA